jgi:hypothetical protein
VTSRAAVRGLLLATVLLTAGGCGLLDHAPAEAEIVNR